MNNHTEKPNIETILNDQVILEGNITQKQPTFAEKITTRSEGKRSK